MTVKQSNRNGVEVFILENKHLAVEIAPSIGGRITSLYHKLLGKEFLWNNKNLALQQNREGDEYDPNFWGGIDELIPNDIPETIDSIAYPDHGELWTTALQSGVLNKKVTVSGKLKLSGLHYEKSVYLDEELPMVHADYKIKNESGARRHFLWKLHAALNIAPGDKIITDARKARIVDPGYSRFKFAEEFSWPQIENSDASAIPANNGTMDFFYLYDITEPEMKLEGADGSLFSYKYDKKIFPYQWYFASYGGFLNHYTAVLEPCSSMPLSVTEAIRAGQCSILEPGEEINTTVYIYAGENK
jgi:hypothetical protein